MFSFLLGTVCARHMRFGRYVISSWIHAEQVLFSWNLRRTFVAVAEGGRNKFKCLTLWPGILHIGR